MFVSNYRRQVIYGKIKKYIGEILKKLCEQKKVEIIEAEANKDHIHLSVSIPTYLCIVRFMGYLKEKAALMILDRYANFSMGTEQGHFGAEVTM